MKAVVVGVDGSLMLIGIHYPDSLEDAHLWVWRTAMALADAQLATAQEIFDEFRELELQPAYLADADANRALLDRRVVCDMLGFDESVYEGVRMLAAKWRAEPSVHGGKRRPAGARLVV